MLAVGTRQLMNQLKSPVPIHNNFMGENLIPVREVKDLGMLLNSHLTYDKHIQALSSSCISKLGQIGRVKHNFDQSTLATIIDTLVMSKINYCSSIWSNMSDSNTKKIQLIQNCAAPLITGVPEYNHVSPTINASGWLPVQEHLLYRDALLTFKSMNDKSPQYLCDKFEQRNRIIVDILEKMETWIFQNSGHRSVKDLSNTAGLRYGIS